MSIAQLGRWLLGATLLATSFFAHADALEGYKINLLLPINDNSTLMVSVPATYKAVQSIEMFSLNKGPILEFIPVNETANKWSEIITLNMIVGGKTSAKAILSSFKENFKAAAQKLTVLEDKLVEKDGYSEGTLVMAYRHQGRDELVHMRYFSGADDLSGIQYAVTVKQGEKVTDVAKRLEQFVDEHVSIR